MQTSKLMPGSKPPPILVNNINGDAIDISKPTGNADWHMIVVYRGRHCPLCTKYLNKLDGYIERIKKVNISWAVVSADSKEQMESHLKKLNISYPLYCGLTIEQMKALGLYISHPRSAEETDHAFPEPGLFVINEEGKLQVVDISNNPFARPFLEGLVKGLEWIRQNDYPIRGTYSD